MNHNRCTRYGLQMLVALFLFLGLLPRAVLASSVGLTVMNCSGDRLKVKMFPAPGYGWGDGDGDGWEIWYGLHPNNVYNFGLGSISDSDDGTQLTQYLDNGHAILAIATDQGNSNMKVEIYTPDSEERLAYCYCRAPDGLKNSEGSDGSDTYSITSIPNRIHSPKGGYFNTDYAWTYVVTKYGCFVDAAATYAGLYIETNSLLPVYIGTNDTPPGAGQINTNTVSIIPGPSLPKATPGSPVGVGPLPVGWESIVPIMCYSSPVIGMAITGTPNNYCNKENVHLPKFAYEMGSYGKVRDDYWHANFNFLVKYFKQTSSCDFSMIRPQDDNSVRWWKNAKTFAKAIPISDALLKVGLTPEDSILHGIYKEEKTGQIVIVTPSYNAGGSQQIGDLAFIPVPDAAYSVDANRNPLWCDSIMGIKFYGVGTGEYITGGNGEAQLLSASKKQSFISDVKYFFIVDPDTLKYWLVQGPGDFTAAKGSELNDTVSLNFWKNAKKLIKVSPLRY